MSPVESHVEDSEVDEVDIIQENIQIPMSSDSENDTKSNDIQQCLVNNYSGSKEDIVIDRCEVDCDSNVIYCECQNMKQDFSTLPQNESTFCPQVKIEDTSLRSISHDEPSVSVQSHEPNVNGCEADEKITPNPNLNNTLAGDGINCDFQSSELFQNPPRIDHSSKLLGDGNIYFGMNANSGGSACFGLERRPQGYSSDVPRTISGCETPENSLLSSSKSPPIMSQSSKLPDEGSKFFGNNASCEGSGYVRLDLHPQDYSNDVPHAIYCCENPEKPLLTSSKNLPTIAQSSKLLDDRSTYIRGSAYFGLELHPQDYSSEVPCTISSYENPEQHLLNCSKNDASTRLLFCENAPFSNDEVSHNHTEPRNYYNRTVSPRMELKSEEIVQDRHCDQTDTKSALEIEDNVNTSNFCSAGSSYSLNESSTTDSQVNFDENANGLSLSKSEIKTETDEDRESTSGSELTSGSLSESESVVYTEYTLSRSSEEYIEDNQSEVDDDSPNRSRASSRRSKSGQKDRENPADNDSRNASDDSTDTSDSEASSCKSYESRSTSRSTRYTLNSKAEENDEPRYEGERPEDEENTIDSYVSEPLSLCGPEIKPKSSVCESCESIPTVTEDEAINHSTKPGEHKNEDVVNMEEESDTSSVSSIFSDCSICNSKYKVKQAKSYSSRCTLQDNIRTPESKPPTEQIYRPEFRGDDSRSCSQCSASSFRDSKYADNVVQAQNSCSSCNLPTFCVGAFEDHKINGSVLSNDINDSESRSSSFCESVVTDDCIENTDHSRESTCCPSTRENKRNAICMNWGEANAINKSWQSDSGCDYANNQVEVHGTDNSKNEQDTIVVHQRKLERGSVIDEQEVSQNSSRTDLEFQLQNLIPCHRAPTNNQTETGLGDVLCTKDMKRDRSLQPDEQLFNNDGSQRPTKIFKRCNDCDVYSDHINDNSHQSNSTNDEGQVLDRPRKYALSVSMNTFQQRNNKRGQEFVSTVPPLSNGYASVINSKISKNSTHSDVHSGHVWAIQDSFTFGNDIFTQRSNISGNLSNGISMSNVDRQCENNQQDVDIQPCSIQPRSENVEYGNNSARCIQSNSHNLESVVNDVGCFDSCPSNKTAVNTFVPQSEPQMTNHFDGVQYKSPLTHLIPCLDIFKTYDKNSFPCFEGYRECRQSASSTSVNSDRSRDSTCLPEIPLFPDNPSTKEQTQATGDASVGILNENPIGQFELALTAEDWERIAHFALAKNRPLTLKCEISTGSEENKLPQSTASQAITGKAKLKSFQVSWQLAESKQKSTLQMLVRNGIPNRVKENVKVHSRTIRLLTWAAKKIKALCTRRFSGQQV